MDDLVEIATVPYLTDAAVLESLLQASGITYYLRNENLAQVLPVSSVGGIGLMVKSIDVQKTVALLKNDGFGNYLNLDFA